jgi:hypothetical protein
VKSLFYAENIKPKAKKETNVCPDRAYLRHPSYRPVFGDRIRFAVATVASDLPAKDIKNEAIYQLPLASASG